MQNPPLSRGIHAKGNLSVVPSDIPTLIDAEESILIRIQMILYANSRFFFLNTAQLYSRMIRCLKISHISRTVPTCLTSRWRPAARPQNLTAPQS